MKKKIALLATGWGCEILAEFIDGLTESLKNTDSDIFLFNCYPSYSDKPSKIQSDLNIFHLPDYGIFEGVILFTSSIGYSDELNNLISRLNKLSIPVISQGKPIDNMYFVHSDNYDASHRLGEHLIFEHNVKSLLFFAGNRESVDSQVRLEAIEAVLNENNMSDALIDVFYTNWENEKVADYLNKHIASGWTPPDAIICANDGLAMQTCLTLSDNEYSVPEDIIVTGFDYINDSRMFYPSIASVDQCFYEMGKKSGELWLNLITGHTAPMTHTVSARFIPGESCGCFDHRDSDSIRRMSARIAVRQRSETTYFNRKLNRIDETTMDAQSFDSFRKSIKELYTYDHDYEGNSFHILFDQRFGPSIYDRNIKLAGSGYSEEMDIIYSTEDGIEFKQETINTTKIIPGYTGQGANHLYTFLPIHNNAESFGYVIFRDAIDSIRNHSLQTYTERLSMALEKFRQSLSLNLLNKRLIDIMRRDPLTNVNNRTAYEDKERYLQTEINLNPNLRFGIVMFDINDLKIINDTYGHDAGDIYIMRCCKLICNTFKHSPIYRIGGDEFIVILLGEDLENIDTLIQQIQNHMNSVSALKLTDSKYVSIASGFSIFDPNTDYKVSDVVKRADKEMYLNKAAMKKNDKHNIGEYNAS